MPQSPQGWHLRFQQQAGWTAQLRRYLLARLELTPRSRLLEIGCGTGVITSWLCEETKSVVCGLDLNLPFLRLAARQDNHSFYCAGNAFSLPFAAGSLDAVLCHFLLLWLPDPSAALLEMVRAVRPGGAVIAFAEPDYGGRIDYPPALETLGRLQADALRAQGANPKQGRLLSGLFHRAGLQFIETGLMGGQWQHAPSPAELSSEWATLQSDLAGTLSPEKLEELRKIHHTAWETGERVLFVPTFYAIGYKEIEN